MAAVPRWPGTPPGSRYREGEKALVGKHLLHTVTELKEIVAALQQALGVGVAVDSMGRLP
jgi:hypothetical protein